jgi:predicted secreted Zn-dependent protease
MRTKPANALRFSCLLLVAVACGPAAPHSISIDEILSKANVVYYEISGATADQLRAQLNVLGPIGDDGYKADATTHWDIHWTWTTNSVSECQLATTTVSYQIQVIFPHWTPPQTASPELIAKWTNYTKALAEHEQGHVDFVVSSIPQLEAAIKGATCETANAAGQAVLSLIRRHDLEYDAATNHGATQGARFP